MPSASWPSQNLRNLERTGALKQEATSAAEIRRLLELARGSLASASLKSNPLEVRNRILPANVDARIDLQLYQPPPVFKAIRDASNASVDLMLRTFNLGVGLAVVCRTDLAASVVEHLTALGERAYVIGEIVTGSGRVDCYGTLSFGA